MTAFQDNTVALNNTTSANPDASSRPAYEKPKINVMDEKEILAAFQITQASVSWWMA